jgi:hypothetical protein
MDILFAKVNPSDIVSAVALEQNSISIVVQNLENFLGLWSYPVSLGGWNLFLGMNTLTVHLAATFCLLRISLQYGTSWHITPQS